MTELFFPKILELIQGKAINDEALGFIDLCGTTSFLSEYIKGKGGSMQAQLTRLQTSFSSALLNAANDNPRLSIIQASDGAFIQGPADDVLIAIIRVIAVCPFIFDHQNIIPIPMRASISSGLVRVAENNNEIEKVKNFKGFPFWGPAFVKTHLMEKQGVKGINVFITDTVASLINEKFQDLVIKSDNDGTVDVLGEGKEKYHIYNWCMLMPDSG